MASLAGRLKQFDQVARRVSHQDLRSSWSGDNVIAELDSVVSQARHLGSQFLAGYGAAQAVPGPLFTFAAYLGAVLSTEPSGLAGAGIALVAVFLPGFLLLLGVIPFWDSFRSQESAQAVMRGTNAAVVGILGAALYDPVFTSAIVGPYEFALALTCFVLLMAWKLPPWVVVLVAALGGILIGVA